MPADNQIVPTTEKSYEELRLEKAAATRAANKLKREQKAAADKIRAATKRKLARAAKKIETVEQDIKNSERAAKRVLRGAEIRKANLEAARIQEKVEQIEIRAEAQAERSEAGLYVVPHQSIKEQHRIEVDPDTITNDDNLIPGMYGFSRLKYNVEKKRALIEQHQADLVVLEQELQIRCGHYDTETYMDQRPGDLYQPIIHVKVIRCKTCGLTRDSQR